MARISTYAQDPLLEGADRVIGSDASNANATMNFSLGSLGDFYTRSGLADATRLGYRFMISTGQEAGTGSFTGGPAMSDITEVFVSATDLRGFGTSVLDSVIGDQTNPGRVKIVSTRETGNETVAQGFYSVGDITPIIESTVVVGYNIPLTAIAGGQEGSLRSTTGVLNPDTEFILIPLPSNAGGTTTAGGPAFAAVEGDTGTVSADTDTNTLDIAGGNQITTTATEVTGGNAVVTVDHDMITTATTTAPDGTTNFISGITIENGHITNVESGTVTIPEDALPFPSLSGNFEEAGFSGAAHSHTFTLSDTTGFTIDPALMDNVASIAENAIQTVTVNPTYTATQDNLLTNTMVFSLSRTFTTFRPVYLDIVSNSNPGNLPAGLPTTYTFVPGDRITRRITSGSTITLIPGSTANPEAIVILSDVDFPSPSFRTGGFLIITPESTIDLTQFGHAYTGYVISLNAGTTLELEIL